MAMKPKAMKRGGATKKMMRGGMVDKPMAMKKGGKLKMVKKDGKMVPDFAAGKMKRGGKAKK